MATTTLPKRNMRNKPVSDIADFSVNLDITYKMDEGFWSIVDSPEFKVWQNTAVKKIARQGKNFELIGTVNGVSIIVRGRRA